jgi:hypothetical protein
MTVKELRVSAKGRWYKSTCQTRTRVGKLAVFNIRLAGSV